MPVFLGKRTAAVVVDVAACVFKLGCICCAEIGDQGVYDILDLAAALAASLVGGPVSAEDVYHQVLVPCFGTQPKKNPLRPPAQLTRLAPCWATHFLLHSCKAEGTLGTLPDPMLKCFRRQAAVPDAGTGRPHGPWH